MLSCMRDRLRLRPGESVAQARSGGAAAKQRTPSTVRASAALDRQVRWMEVLCCGIVTPSPDAHSRHNAEAPARGKLPRARWESVDDRGRTVPPPSMAPTDRPSD